MEVFEDILEVTFFVFVSLIFIELYFYIKNKFN